MLKTLDKPKTQQVGTLVITPENSDDSAKIDHAAMRYGACRRCSCPGFTSGAGESTCWRSGCGHHYDEHW